MPKQAAVKAAPLWRRAVKARPAPTFHGADDEQEHALEAVVDVHAFIPSDLETFCAGAGFSDVRVQGEELLASWSKAVSSQRATDSRPSWVRSYWAKRNRLAGLDPGIS